MQYLKHKQQYQYIQQYITMMQIYKCVYHLKYFCQIIDIYEFLANIGGDINRYDVSGDLLEIKENFSKFAHGAMSAAFRVAFNDGFNKYPSRLPAGRITTEKEAIEAAHNNNQSARRIGRTEFGKYSSLRGDANGVYVYYNEDQGYYEVSSVMVVPRNGVNWSIPDAAFGEATLSDSPPHIRPFWWFNDDKTIIALVVTQDPTHGVDYSANYQKYANKIGTVVVSTENNYHYTNYKFGITTKTFNAQSATNKYE